MLKLPGAGIGFSYVHSLELKFVDKQINVVRCIELFLLLQKSNYSGSRKQKGPAELQLRSGNRDNSKIFFSVSQYTFLWRNMEISLTPYLELWSSVCSFFNNTHIYDTFLINYFSHAVA